jgi:hypothetical protein
MDRRTFLRASGLLCLSTQLPSVLATHGVGMPLESASGGFTLGTLPAPLRTMWVCFGSRHEPETIARIHAYIGTTPVSQITERALRVLGGDITALVIEGQTIIGNKAPLTY